MSSIQRIFCGSSGQISREGARYLLKTFSLSCDSTSSVKAKGELPIILVPGKRAIRTLRDHLIREAGEKPIYCPTMITPGGLPEQIMQKTCRYASPHEVSAAYVQTLKGLDRDTFMSLYTRSTNALREREWWSIADELIAYYQELSAACARDKEVLEAVARLSEHSSLEQNRWETFFHVRDSALALLEAEGLHERNNLRRQYLKERSEFETRPLVLVGVPELSPVLQAFINCCASVHILVQADETEAESLDEFGQPLTASWFDYVLDLSSVSIIPTRTIEDEARCVAAACRRHAEEHDYLPVICTADASRQEMLAHRLSEQGLKAHYTEGLQLSRTSLASFLRCLTAAVLHRDWHASSALFRHPYVEQWYEQILKQGSFRDALRELDITYANSLYFDLHEHDRPLPKLVQDIHMQLEPLFEYEASLASWPSRIAPVLYPFVNAYFLSLSDESQKQLKESYQSLQELLLEFVNIPEKLAPEVSGSTFLSIIQQAFAKRTAGIQADEEGIEMLGWLEVLHDNGEHLFLCGANEGMLPESVTSDAWLPHSVRDQLGIKPNDERYVRDLFILSRLLKSRASVTITYALQGGRGEPLKPGRMLYAVARPQLGKQVKVLFTPYDIPLSTNPQEPADPMRIPPAVEGVVERSVYSVSELGMFLRDPYRYYLRYGEQLSSTNDEARELNALQFGSVAHEVLEKFAATPGRRALTKSSEIRAFLHKEVESIFVARYGHRMLPAVRIQMIQLQYRLSLFADWQAAWIRQGNAILDVERRIEMPLDVDGTTVQIRGTIDRIDRAADGRVYVFDYKTSDSDKRPASEHYNAREGRWKNLQLPLYQHLLRSVKGYQSEEIVPAYIPLTDSVSQMKIRVLEGKDWDEERFDDALECARSVIRKIRTAEFVQADTYPYTDEFSLLLGDKQRIDGRYRPGGESE